MRRIFALIVIAIAVIAGLAACPSSPDHRPCSTEGETKAGATRYETYRCVRVPGGELQWERDDSSALMVAVAGFWSTGKGTVYVHSSLANSAWNKSVVTATSFIDGYTGSSIRNTHCKAGSRCIEIRFGNVSGTSLGRTVCHNSNCTITVKRNTPVRYRTLLAVHELGHAFGLNHNPRCVSIMYPYRTCWARLNGSPFTTTEKALLRTH